MPFEQLTPRPLTQGAVRLYAPTAAGVYGISNAREWVYIGESDNIQAALLEHLGDLFTPLLQHTPTGFVFEVCAGARRLDRQGRLVSEYHPACNQPAARSPRRT
jgi:hypothetical protein